MEVGSRDHQSVRGAEEEGKSRPECVITSPWCRCSQHQLCFDMSTSFPDATCDITEDVNYSGWFSGLLPRVHPSVPYYHTNRGQWGLCLSTGPQILHPAIDEELNLPCIVSTVQDSPQFRPVIHFTSKASKLSLRCRGSSSSSCCPLFVCFVYLHRDSFICAE